MTTVACEKLLTECIADSAHRFAIAAEWLVWRDYFAIKGYAEVDEKNMRTALARRNLLLPDGANMPGRKN